MGELEFLKLTSRQTILLWKGLIEDVTKGLETRARITRQGSNKNLQPFFKGFSWTFHGPPTTNVISQITQNAHSQSILTGLELFLSPSSLHLSSHLFKTCFTSLAKKH